MGVANGAHSEYTRRTLYATSCPNLNHRRSDAAVRFCPSCGEVVGQSIAVRHCQEALHAKERMEHSVFCVHCGKRLIPKQGR